jgi:acetyl-CoA carboxylase carboxyl transferase subunit alpha
MRHFLEFEKPLAELEGKIEELKHLSDANLSGPGDLNIAEEVARLREKADKLLRATYAKLTAWQKTQVARHPERPKALAYVARLIADWTPLSGDRAFGEDAAVVAGLGRFQGRSVAVLGTEKGADTESRVKHGFGMARPEGYRKARRIIELAGRFKLPVLTFVDTAGAYPGIDAEARGQAEAIARSIEACLAAPVPFIAAIIGEGGSGGAIALASADRVIMLEHSVYSVISPEGCASILWRDGAHAADAAEAMQMSAESLKKFGIVDMIVPEPMGGAHRDPPAAISAVGEAMAAELATLSGVAPEALLSQRREKFLAMGRAVPG